ncbi:DUF4258 domain-containing protein [Enterovirga sp. CN4-39]|uniref:DUF4258 domain-containing protein n=1 Tax=Enterovirga sp. CN4-39 TaxID=3400910 RepID=UPI003C06A9F9
MSATLDRVRALAARGAVVLSRHGSGKLLDRGLMIADLVDGLDGAVVVEEYPDHFKGPSVLVLQHDSTGRPVHVLWGLEKGTISPAVLVTAYRPEVTRWSTDFLVRRR